MAHPALQALPEKVIPLEEGPILGASRGQILAEGGSFPLSVRVGAAFSELRSRGKVGQDTALADAAALSARHPLSMAVPPVPPAARTGDEPVKPSLPWVTGVEGRCPPQEDLGQAFSWVPGPGWSGLWTGFLPFSASELPALLTGQF